MSAETILTHARIVCRDRIIDDGTVVVRKDRIAAVEDRPSALGAAIDLEGDYLLPGLVEMHTDNLERHLMPRPGVLWPSALAEVLGHDLEVAGAGITTVFDAISLGAYEEKKERHQLLNVSVPALHHARAEKLTRAEHFLHLRCEVAYAEVMALFEPHIGDPLVRLASVMDHTPGQRQWWDVRKYVEYYKGESWTETELTARIDGLRREQARHADQHRRAIVAACRDHGIPLASHDDATDDHVHESIAEGVAIAEFPLTLAAATLARAHGIKTIMGAPNVVRGQSHSGNMSALDCARAGQLDGLSSDYVPAALLFAAFLLTRRLGWPLSEAVAAVSDNVARMVGLTDRGRIEPGLRADLAWVRDTTDCPVVRRVWAAGNRVI